MTIKPLFFGRRVLTILLLAGSAPLTFGGEASPILRSAPVPAQIAPASNPLSLYGGVFTFDIQERLRWEIRDNNFDFDDSTNALTDDNWFLQRFRFGLAVKPASWLKIYAQVQDAREINSDRPDYPGTLGAEGDDAFDLRQGYVEVGNVKAFPLTLKVGRQTLAYGDERLVGLSDWGLGRTFDAAKLRWEDKQWSLDVFAASVVALTRGEYNQSDFVNGNETDRDQVFSGLYFATTALPFQTTDVYALHLYENQNPKYLPTARGDTSFATIGLRVKSKAGYFAKEAVAEQGDGKFVAPLAPASPPTGFDYDGEFVFQTGKLQGLDLTAWAVHGGIGYTFDEAWLPRLGVTYSYGSGDQDPADNDRETFQNLFPANHRPYGQMDVFSWQNVHDLEFNVKAQPTKSVSLRAEFHAFWLASTDDVWYRSNGSTAVRPLTTGARNASNYAGSELGLIVQWTVTKNFALEAGYSRFFAGDYLADTGPSDDADFGYVQTTIEF